MFQHLLHGVKYFYYESLNRGYMEFSLGARKKRCLNKDTLVNDASGPDVHLDF